MSDCMLCGEISNHMAHGLQLHRGHLTSEFLTPPKAEKLCMQPAKNSRQDSGPHFSLAAGAILMLQSSSKAFLKNANWVSLFCLNHLPVSEESANLQSGSHDRYQKHALTAVEVTSASKQIELLRLFSTLINIEGKMGWGEYVVLGNGHEQGSRRDEVHEAAWLVASEVLHRAHRDDVLPFSLALPFVSDPVKELPAVRSGEGRGGHRLL